MNENKNQQLVREISAFCKERLTKVDQKHISIKPLIQTILTMTISIALGGNSDPNKRDFWLKE